MLETIRRGNGELAKLLIDHGATVDGKNKAVETTLMEMVGKEDLAMVSMLLDAGADAGGQDSNGRSIPDRIIEAGNVDMLEFFIEKTDGVITDGWVLYAFEIGNADLLKSLFKMGGNVEAKDGNDERPLKRAVLNKDLPMAELLLNFGADPKGEVWNALASADPMILEQLLKKGADANESLVVGVGSPLSLTLRQRRYAAAELLLKYGADPNPPLTGGQTLIEGAKIRGDERAVLMLQDYLKEATSPDEESKNKDEAQLNNKKE